MGSNDMKYFIITIDTEGDNLWQWKIGDQITTENAKYIPRFQKLCEKYNFPPVYLTNYEMANDDFFVDYLSKKLRKGHCEIGMHLHAWNTPPIYALPVRTDCQSGAPYLIEYPFEIMEAKIKTMTTLLEIRFGEKPVSHRAGRWATNDTYMRLLEEYGYLIDCSVTPGLDLSKLSPGQTPYFSGPDYSTFPHELYPVIYEDSALMEYPVTILKTRQFLMPDKKTARGWARAFKRSIIGQSLWLRPNGNNTDAMLYLLSSVAKSDRRYVMFMLHSSELMPGGSPTFLTQDSIEHLYKQMNVVFEQVTKYGFIGTTFKALIKG